MDHHRRHDISSETRKIKRNIRSSKKNFWSKFLHQNKPLLWPFGYHRFLIKNINSKFISCISYSIRTSFLDRTEVSRSGSLLNTDKQLTISLAVELMIPARILSVGENSTWLPSKTTFTRNSGLGELLPSPFMARDSSCKDHFVFSLNASSTIRSILSVKRIQLFCTWYGRQLTVI